MKHVPEHLREIIKERIYAKTLAVRRSLDTDCWEYQGATDEDGYGKVKVGKEVDRTYRVVFLCTGDDAGFDLADGEVVRHRCDNPPCSRPDHLLRGTHAQNMQDMVERGRHVGTAILTELQRIDIWHQRLCGSSVDQIAKRFGVKSSTVSAVLNSQNWTDSCDFLEDKVA